MAIALRNLRFGGLLLALLCMAGCVEVRAKLEADGSGSLVMRFSPLNAAGDEHIRSQIPSPSVKLVKASHVGSVGTYEIAFSDVRKLRTSPLLRHVRLVYSGDDGPLRTIDVSLPRRPRADKEPTLPDGNDVAIALTLALPGPITETNGKISAEDSADWMIRVDEMLGKGYVKAHATYRVPATP